MSPKQTYRSSRQACNITTAYYVIIALCAVAFVALAMMLLYRGQVLINTEAASTSSLYQTTSNPVNLEASLLKERVTFAAECVGIIVTLVVGVVCFRKVRDS